MAGQLVRDQEPTFRARGRVHEPAGLGADLGGPGLG